MDTYEKALNEILKKEKDLRDVLNQNDCEYEWGFLGFIDNYWEARKLIPSKDYTVIDIGCYCGAQSYLFTEFNGYVGVEIPDIHLTKKCSPDNAVYFDMTGQEFLKEKISLFGNRIFVIMSAVPDSGLEDMVYEQCKNCFIAYPGEKPRVKVNGKKVLQV